jgi:Protein kinase domain
MLGEIAVPQCFCCVFRELTGAGQPVFSGLNCPLLAADSNLSSMYIFLGAPLKLPERQKSFEDLLKSSGISNPNQQVLTVICKRYSQQMQAAMTCQNADVCRNIYEDVKLLPSSYTRGKIEKEVDIRINGPMSLAQPNILVGIDFSSDSYILIKLLSPPQTVGSQSHSDRDRAVACEVETCRVLGGSSVEGLVKCKVVEVYVEHNEQLNVAGRRAWSAIKMHRYLSSLAECPQHSEPMIKQGFRRIRMALEAMHRGGFVHMDVKSDNVFVDEPMKWDLGDFGSTRKIGDGVWTWTEVMNPFDIPKTAKVHASMDMVQLCVMIAIELDKDNWKSQLCGHKQRVQALLVRERLFNISDEEFKTEVLLVFDKELDSVEKALTAERESEI